MPENHLLIKALHAKLDEFNVGLRKVRQRVVELELKLEQTTDVQADLQKAIAKLIVATGGH